MFDKPKIATTCSVLLAVTLLIAGCAQMTEKITGRYKVDNLKWCKKSGSVERKNNSIVLHDSKEKTEMWGDVSSADLDCEFVLEFDLGRSDSSVGLVYWYKDGEYGITFRGGFVKVIAAGEVVTTTKVESSYAGKRIGVHLQASDEWLFAEIDDVAMVNKPNTYWSGRKLKPRLNADIGDTITLHSSSCTIR